MGACIYKESLHSTKFLLHTQAPLKYCVYTFLYICSTHGNLQLTTKFFYVMCKISGINNYKLVNVSYKIT